MSKATKLFIGEAVSCVVGLGLSIAGWVTHNEQLSSIGLPLFFSALAAWGVARPKDVQ